MPKNPKINNQKRITLTVQKKRLRIMILEKIFGFMGVFYARFDANKNTQGMGTIERYMRSFGDDIDTNILPMVENLTRNLIDSDLMLTRYLDYHEEVCAVPTISFGNDSSAEWQRRRILKHINKFKRVRGSKLGFTQLIQLLDPTAIIVISEKFANNIYDYSAEGYLYDDEGLRFDTSICSECCRLAISVTTDSGTALTALTDKALQVIIDFNLPVDVKIESVLWNGLPISEIQTDGGATELSNEFSNGEFLGGEFM